MLFSKNKKSTVIITGASGFIGKNLLEYLKDDYTIIAIARRSMRESGVNFHGNIHWLQWDIANDRFLNLVLGYVIGKGSADYMIHLAGYYNFDYDDNKEYERTNVVGTRNVLELARKANVKRFIFSSSLAACDFAEPGIVINEKSQPDSNFSYAISKLKGEQMVKEYSKHFKCSIIRFAAVFSDWCEYAPLYKFLYTWLGNKWDSRILAGKGESAVSYIHIHDLVRMIKVIIQKTDKLKEFDIYNASPDGSASHLELFKVATRDYYGYLLNPIFLPRALAYPGIIARQIMGKLNLIADPFERLWMVKYIDKKLHIDSFYTRNELGWEPTPRYHILRRMLFLLSNMKSHPLEWELINETAMKRVSYRPNLRVFEHMFALQDKILEDIYISVLSEEKKEIFPMFQNMNNKELQTYLGQIYNLLLASVRSSDRSLMVKFIDDLAVDRFAAGFEKEEMISLFWFVNEVLVKELLNIKELQSLKQEIYDLIGLTIQLAIDELEETFEHLGQKLTPEKISSLKSLQDKEAMHKKIESLSSIYQEPGS